MMRKKKKMKSLRHIALLLKRLRMRRQEKMKKKREEKRKEKKEKNKDKENEDGTANRAANKKLLREQFQRTSEAIQRAFEVVEARCDDPEGMQQVEDAAKQSLGQLTQYSMMLEAVEDQRVDPIGASQLSQMIYQTEAQHLAKAAALSEALRAQSHMWLPDGFTNNKLRAGWQSK